MRKAKTQSIELWAGTEKSYQDYSAKKEEGASLDIKMMSSMSDGAESTGVPYLLSIEGSTAIIHINGSLTNSDDWYNEFLKIPSYNAIREALVYAAIDPYIEQIVLHINSGGGPVAGIADTVGLIKQINSQVVPVYTYTESMLCSAAYWLASSSGLILASELASVGSIGVIATHIESSQQLTDDGVKITLVRAGEFKALANPYEPLSTEARAQIQEQIDGIYDTFTQHVAENRNKTQAQVISTMAEGREFLGKKALAVGLIDGVTSYNQLLTSLENTSLDTRSKTRQTANHKSHGVNPMKTRLTAQQIAIKAAGGSVEISADVAGTTEALLPITVDTDTIVDTPDDGTDGTQPIEDAKAGLSTTDKEVTLFTKETLDLLHTQLSNKDAQILDLSVQLATTNSKLNDGTEHVKALVKIAADSTNNMRVALGISALDMASLGAAEVVAQHSALSNEFTKKFAVGGVAAVEANANVTVKPQVTGLRLAQLESVGAKHTK